VNLGSVGPFTHLEVGFFDGSSGLLVLPDLLVYYLPGLAPLRLHHLLKASGVIRQLVVRVLRTDDEHAQFGSSPRSKASSRLGRQGGFVGAVGGQ
jgi:hypothetical protein